MDLAAICGAARELVEFLQNLLVNGAVNIFGKFVGAVRGLVKFLSSPQCRRSFWNFVQRLVHVAGVIHVGLFINDISLWLQSDVSYVKQNYGYMMMGTDRSIAIYSVLTVGEILYWIWYSYRVWYSCSLPRQFFRTLIGDLMHLTSLILLGLLINDISFWLQNSTSHLRQKHGYMFMGTVRSIVIYLVLGGVVTLYYVPYDWWRAVIPDFLPQENETVENTSKSIDKLPEGVTQLNDSLYQLYAPESGEPEIDIIFFHGLQAGNDYRNAYWKSWMSEDGKILWPQALLGKEFPNARILSVSYDFVAKRTSLLGGGYTVGEIFVEDIILSEPQRGNRPILLVGHSLGGLLLKNFIMMAPRIRESCYPEVASEAQRIAKINTFLANMCGIFYYATPHAGTKLADIASEIPGRSEVLIFLKIRSKELARQNRDFAKWRKENRVPVFSLGESLFTDPEIWGVKGMEPTQIVDEPSCRVDTDFYSTVPRANHITICQPNKENQGSFSKLEQFVKNCLEASLNERLNRLRSRSQQASTTGTTRMEV